MLTKDLATVPNDLESFWMPFTANREFKKNPRLLVKAQGLHYTTHDGRQLLDATAGLWCVNAGHAHPKIVKAIQKQAAELDFAPPFQWGHPKSFELASRLAHLFPGKLDHAFFTNSGSESVDTALKIALAYHRNRGQGTRTRLIGRERGYHGVGFGGISVGGMVKNRMYFGSLLTGVDHLPHTYSLEHQAYSKGQPAWGAHLADELERLVALHDASNIAAVIVEPVAGSTGVLAPPQGYLEKLRAITKKHGILLIFDEVITAYGRLGKGSAAEHFGVEPDIITTAKGLTSATIPMGAVMVSKEIYETFMETGGSEKAIELFHGYTYSAHPVACAAALATLDVYRDEGVFENAASLVEYWGDAVHSLKGLPNVIDIRTVGIMAAVELSSRPGAVAERAYDAMLLGYEKGIMLRVTGDTIAMSPPLVLTKAHIDEIVDKLGSVLKELP
ncbi:MAG TPA: aspartate aminotransferase family protein [Geminicoccus sp.]|jgi:beta-alanine--pyruvate transaminase|uniref:aspartate aminotransferase family protein n=1 Tax=Geminicoccus sp. TaxID=2024832 RepID=UPI002E30188F|nr:aspartate aminotransferase family protein [Geminicoccus sp.]HEX2529091.1 aspartate aminotransferase family protein [Geminicoccus sp.]